MARTRHKSLQHRRQEYLDKILTGVQVSYGPLNSDPITIKIEFGNLTFELLRKLSKALQTRLIDIGARHVGPGCDTCGCGGDTWAEVHVRGPIFPE